MNSRRKFLFNLVKTAIAVTAAPSLLDAIAQGKVTGPEELEILTAKPVLLSPRKIVTHFKCSKELLEDYEAFLDVVNDAGIPDKRPSHIEVGLIGDDFIKDLFTVKLTYHYENN